MPGTVFVPVFFSETTVCLLRFLCERGQPAKGADYLAPSRAVRCVALPGVSRCGKVPVAGCRVKAGAGNAIKVVALDCSFIDFFTRVDFYGFLLPG